MDSNYGRPWIRTLVFIADFTLDINRPKGGSAGTECGPHTLVCKGGQVGHGGAWMNPELNKDMWWRQWTFGFYKMRKPSLLAVKLVAFQEGVCFMESAGQFVFRSQ